MTECQGCGAWNERSRERCVLCGTPLAETDEWEATAELPPLPPLPDGGLRDSMPSWLREPPPSPITHHPFPQTSNPRPSTPLGPRADPRTFLSDDDFPPWLRELAAREARNPRVFAATNLNSAPSNWPEWPATVAPSEDDRPAAAMPTPAVEERRARAAWETLLLVILFLGVVAAALWALISNGVFSLGL